MQWVEVSIKVTQEAQEVAAEILRSAGTQGVVIDDPQLLNQLRASGTWELCDIPEQTQSDVVTLSAYYPDDAELTRRLAEIEKELALLESRLGTCRCGTSKLRCLAETDWENEWKQYFHVTHVGKQLVIRPSWESYQPALGEKIITIDPGMAFGTGTHPTTNICLEQLEAILADCPLATVFDVGTGSGILAIAAALCGAVMVEAIDIDPTAVRVARENIAANGLAERIDVRAGDLLSDTQGQADLIVANIIASVIITLLPAIPQKLKDRGIFLAGGIIAEQQTEVIEAARAVGLNFYGRTARDGWVVLQFRKE